MVSDHKRIGKREFSQELLFLVELFKKVMKARRKEERALARIRSGVRIPGTIGTDPKKKNI